MFPLPVFSSLLCLLLLSALAAPAIYSAEQAEGLLIRNATVMTMGPQGTLERASVYIEDGKIKDVGKIITAPKDVRVIDGEGKYLLPAHIQARSVLGLNGRRGSDVNSATTPLRPELDAFWAIDPFHRSFAEVRKNGLGYAFVAPGTLNLIGGQGIFIRTKGTLVDDLTVKREAGMLFSLGETPKGHYGGRGSAPSTRMGEAAMIRQALLGAQDYKKKWEDYAEKYTDWADTDSPDPKDEPKKPDVDLGKEALRKVLSQKIPAIFTAHRADDIHSALRIAKEFDLRLILDGGTDAFMLTKELKALDIPVLFGPIRQSSRPMELLNHSPKTPGLLEKAGLLVALKAAEGGLYGPEGTRELPLDAAFAFKNGMTELGALKAVTVNPAIIFGVDDRLGSIEVGKDASLVLYSGHPFKIRSLPVMTIIDGDIVWPKE